MAAMASNSSTAKESLLLSHAEATDEWAGWCTVESEPVPILEEVKLTLGHIQSTTLGHWRRSSSSTRNIYPGHGILYRHKVFFQQISLTQACPWINIPFSMEERTQ
jgi:hypothetical protein